MEISGSRRTSLPALRSSETKRLRAIAIPPPSIAACKTTYEQRLAQIVFRTLD